MTYITGDTHIPIDIHKLNNKFFPEQKLLTETDYVIICGDFGGVWDLSNEELYWLKWLDKKNFTTLFVDGNHENFDLLNNNFEVVDLLGGKSHKISDKIYHLMRGEIFTIEGKTIFVMGGAQSSDMEYRKEGKSWWASELPSQQEYENANMNLERYNYNVDYVVTHCASRNIQYYILPHCLSNNLTDYLEDVRHKLTYKKWFFGHYHINRKITEKDFALFDDIILI